MKNMDEKFKRDKLTFNRITNQDLVCRNCKYRMDDSEVMGNTSKCQLYPRIKPTKVLQGEDCEVKAPD